MVHIMATKKAEVKAAVKEVETIKYRIEFPDGSVSEGTTSLREFKPRADGKKNSGYQCKIASGVFSGSIMIVDYSKQARV